MSKPSNRVPRWTQTAIPEVPKALLECLDALYPNQQPVITDSDREIWIRVGQRQVIDLLQHHFDKQTTPRPTVRTTV